MATEEPAPRLDGITTLLEILFILFIVATVLNRIPMLIEEKTGINIFDISGSYERMTAINANTPLGTVVRLKDGVEILGAPGFGRVLGFQDSGAYGFLEAGPERTETGRWWYVNFEDDPDGWVDEDMLTNGSIARASQILTALFYIGASVLIAGALALVLYLVVRINQVRAREVRAMKAAVQSAQAEVQALSMGGNPRWRGVVANIESDNPNDWRHAIIEADSMLDELVIRMGYRGESLGERLKQIEKSDFTTIELAWEAHKVRNQIAHAGSDYVLSKRDAKRAIDCYRQVFEEFYYI